MLSIKKNKEVKESPLAKSCIPINNNDYLRVGINKTLKIKKNEEYCYKILELSKVGQIIIEPGGSLHID